MSRNKLLLFVFFTSLIINFLALFLLFKSQGDVLEANKFNQLEQKYPLLSKRILKDFPQDILINFLDLRNDLREITSPWENTFGLYFEYLPTGTSININGQNEFHAASLFKLPVVMAYYRHKYRTSIKNDPEITLTKDMLDKQFGDLWKKGAGYQLKASDAVRMALVNSDNTAARSLTPLIAKEDFESVYQGLDIELNSDDEGAILSAKSYSSILKALYFSSVLDKDSSQEILNLLTKTIFPDKLVAGIPHDILVAHKIGDYNDNKGNEAFMDCGIVYVPRRPYLLCMVSVTDEQTARDRMSSVSRSIYNYVSNTP